MNQMDKQLGAGTSSLLAVVIVQARMERESGGRALKEKDSPLLCRCKEKQNKQGQDGRVSPA